MLTLYFAPGSSSMAVHIALHEIGAPSKASRCRSSTTTCARRNFLTLNPAGKVPTLVIDGRSTDRGRGHSVLSGETLSGRGAVAA